MKIMMIIVIVLILGALFIVQRQDTNFKTFSGTYTFSKIYIKWVWQISVNVKNLAVYAWHMKWIPELGNITKPSETSAPSAENFTNITPIL